MLLQSLQPFNLIDSVREDLLLEASETPELGRVLTEIEKVFSDEGPNEKAEFLDSLYCAYDGDIHVWNRPWNESPPGWPLDANQRFESEYGSRVRIIGGIREIPEVGDSLVLVSPLHSKRFPFASAVKLLRQGRWKCVHVLRYGVAIESDDFTREALSPMFKERSWRVTWETHDHIIGSVADLVEEGQDRNQDIPFIADDLFSPSDRTDESAGEPVSACVVRFQSGEYVALSVGDDVRLLNGQRKRVPVLDLQSGDLIPVNVDDPDRELLESGAQQRLGIERVESVKKRMRAWKQIVRTCLNHCGDAKFKAAFDERGKDTWRQDAWTGELPWAPAKRADFRALILAARDLGFFRAEEDIEVFIQHCWSDVQSLRSAHRSAGRDLVHRLDDELEADIASGVQWEAGNVVGEEHGGRKYVVLEVMSVGEAGKLYPSQLQRLKNWQG
ncbi:hypothetical protein GCM10028862_03160 [Luteimonas pelagia]